MALADALSDVEDTVQRAAAIALGQIAPESSGAVSALASALSAENPQTRREAARALGMLATEASGALAALQDSAENDEIDYVRLAATEAIAAILAEEPGEAR